MTYNPTNWQNGDTITATALNNMETGIGNAGSVVLTIDADTQGIGVSYNDIASYMENGRYVYIYNEVSPNTFEILPYIAQMINNGTYMAIFYVYEEGSAIRFVASSADAELILSNTSS